MNKELPQEQARVINVLEPGGERRVADLARDLDVDQAQVAAAAVLLAGESLVRIREEAYREWVLKEAGRASAAAEIPERRVLRALLAHGGAGSMAELAEWTGMEAKEVGQSLKGLGLRGWAEKKGASLTVSDAGRSAEESAQADEDVLGALREAAETPGVDRLAESELVARGCDVERARQFLGPRNPLVEIRDKVHRWVSLTAEGEAVRRQGVHGKPEVSLLTPELLAQGGWREVRFKPYDVQLATEPRHPGKRHPLARVIGDTRRVFFSMGFEERNSPCVESAFWDFDALFQPQDHPAREMQDTFYVARPGSTPLPQDRAMVERVRRTHEDGGETGSIGWQYHWVPATAERNVLRTHNTATTIRAVAEVKKGPRKIFSVGRVFRREAIDATHLAIFFQVDGIIIDEKASFSSLLGTLRAFYERMGFERFFFRPSFFPYTEPSVEVFVWHEGRKDWVEMGGAGVFRPEVTEPLGCSETVLAWGLGLERLAMFRAGLDDIRDLYLADLEKLKGVAQCR
jgi:phenylalanyl-tRNA synthetase alpha chain